MLVDVGSPGLTRVDKVVGNFPGRVMRVSLFRWLVTKVDQDGVIICD